MHNILIVEDKKSMADMLKKTLQMEGFSAVTAHSVQGGLAKLSEGGIDAVITDLKLPDGEGTEILRASKESHPLLPVIIMTAYGSIELAVNAVKFGAYDFITKPFNTEHLVLILRRAISESKISKENIIIKDEFPDLFKPPDVVGSSPAWKEILLKVKRVAPLKTTVLILGESGTGKELISRTIHHMSPRSSNPFVAINCAAVPKDLIENEIFGHEKGAFTGANEVKPGKFELADKGTILLDEIGDMSLSLQSKLLRVLEESEFERIGGAKSIKVDVRIIAASNKDLQTETGKGSFREDLFYRLNVFPIFIPPLRERVEDIIPLARHFISRFCREMHKTVVTFSPQAEKMLMSNDWKGNVRELRNTIERAVILCDSSSIMPEHLNLQEAFSGSKIDWEAPLQDVVESAVKAVEKTRILNALKQSQGNKTKAAELLKVSYKTLLTKIKDYGFEQ